MHTCSLPLPEASCSALFEEVWGHGCDGQLHAHAGGCRGIPVLTPIPWSGKSALLPPPSSAWHVSPAGRLPSSISKMKPMVCGVGRLSLFPSPKATLGVSHFSHLVIPRFLRVRPSVSICHPFLTAPKTLTVFSSFLCPHALAFGDQNGER